MSRTQTKAQGNQGANGELLKLMQSSWNHAYKDALDCRLYVNYRPVLDATGSIAKSRGKKPHATYGFLDPERKRIVLSEAALKNEESKAEWVSSCLAQLIPLAYLNETSQIDIELIEKSYLLSGVASRYHLDSLKRMIAKSNEKPKESSENSNGNGLNIDYERAFEETATLLFPKGVNVLSTSDEEVERAVYDLSDDEIADLFYLEDGEMGRIPALRKQLVDYNRGFRVTSRFIDMTDKWLADPRPEELVPGSKFPEGYPNSKYVYLAVLNAAKREGTVDKGILSVESALTQNIHEAFRAGELAVPVGIDISILEGAISNLDLDISRGRQFQDLIGHLNHLLVETNHLSLYKLSANVEKFRTDLDKHPDKTSAIDAVAVEGLRKIIRLANEEYLSKGSKKSRYRYKKFLNPGQ